MTAPVGNYTAVILVRDTSDPEVLSELELELAFNILPRAKLIVFPPTAVRAEGGGQAGGVVAGYRASPEIIWLINIAPDEEANVFSIVPKEGAFDGVEPWVEATPTTGTLENTGDVGEVTLNFTVVHTLVQQLTMDFVVTSSSDAGKSQDLRVIYMVVPDVVSNRSVVSVSLPGAAPGGAAGPALGGGEPAPVLVSGTDAEFTIDSRDQYDNHLDTIETFTFDIFQVERDGVVAADPAKFAFTTSRLEYDSARNLLTGRIQEVKPNGEYQVFVRFVSKAAGVTQTPLDAYPAAADGGGGANWTDPEG
eukprot:CAMPEP_0118927486 /NCGR_PEP_ID=MMETSP1169-20130426/4944_1 /TAXON_ID=36882 /ORGANISM="Pyramimonas obovata, Strain CCMP722" /LENGTH=306 /DNA_ID=CAMNT_0006869247 /DNA_START=20 /DNA_END=936 /DNA_ORIENTATION=+